ncbi:MAG: hypothetical protein QOI41_7436 [Myxococcales bacterium]|nr:hypothetical protein [Myxococcales bacterium]
MLGLGGLMLSAVSRVAVAGPVQVEAEGYAGSSVGQWTCGPSARANYGGVGGHVRFYADDRVPRPPEEETSNGGALRPDSDPNADPNADPDADPDANPAQPGPPAPAPIYAPTRSEEATLDIEPDGFSIGGGGGGEYRSFTRTRCSEQPCTTNDVIPPSRLLPAGRANFGWDTTYFGSHVGALVFQRWASNTDGSPTTNVLPDSYLRFGRRLGFHGELGFGAYDVSTIFRPGLYGGVGYASGAWAADLRVGGHETFDDQAGLRGDLSARYAISRVVAPGLGVAVSSTQQTTPEGRLFIVFTP